jgi:signal transduction histidine kinase
MSPEQYKSVIEKRGVHSFVLYCPRVYRAISSQDFGCARLSGAGDGIGSWIGTRVAQRSKILRAANSPCPCERMNTHLKEMNLAAAGLAHETRNPLNIIRGWRR